MSTQTTVSAIICDSYEQKTLYSLVVNCIESAGGLPKPFKPGARILINPNLLSPRTPDQAVTTHPEFVRAVILYLKAQGINDLTLGDSPANENSWNDLWEKTGMKKVCEEESVKLIPFDDFERLETPFGVIPVLKGYRTDYDAILSLPKLKTHLLTKITIAVKNSYGLVVGVAKSSFHGDHPAPKKMSEFLGNIYPYIKPDFSIVDGIIGMEGDGPANGSPFHAHLILAGEDAAAIDAVACKAYGYTTKDIPLLLKVAELNAGVIDEQLIKQVGNGFDHLNALNGRTSRSGFLNAIPEPLFHIGTYFLQCRPLIEQSGCIKCGACKKVCSQNAISIKNGKYIVDGKKCILCMCCLESCPKDTIHLTSGFQRVIRLLFKKK